MMGPTPDWTRLREAVRAGETGQPLLSACRALREWIDLPAPECARRVAAAVDDEAAARALLQAKAVVSTRLWRETFGVAVEPSPAALTQLAERSQGGTATPAEQRYIRRFAALQTIVGEVVQAFPAAVEPPAPPDARREELDAMLPALQRAMRDCAGPGASPEQVAALETAIAQWRHGGDAWAPPLPLDHAWWLGMALYWLGSALLGDGDVERARTAFSEGATHFERAGAADHAQDMHQRVTGIDNGVRADCDAVTAPSLRALLGPQEPLERCASLAALASAAHDAGDHFEFVRLAELLAELLAAAGYADPQPQVETAVLGWVDTAADTLQGNALLARLGDVGTHWCLVMGARATAPLGDGKHLDAAAGARAEASLAAIATLLGQVFEVADAVRSEVAAELATWFGSTTAGIVGARPGEAVPDGTHQVLAANQTERVAALNAALYALRLACNEGPAEAHLTKARRLITEAEALGWRAPLVQAQLELGYVLLALKRYNQVPDLTAAALRTLAPTRAASLDAFSVSYERELYLTAVQFEVRARAGLRDHEAVLATCRRVIAQIEEQRTRVSAQYQQAAFLATRAEFYEYCAAAALKLGRHDLLVATTEHLKASGAWRLPRVALERLPAAAAAQVTGLDQEYAEVNRALALAPPGGPVTTQLLERRRRVAAARGIARQRAQPLDAPTLTVAAVQGALAADEAALSWFWLRDEVLIGLAFTRERFETAVIEPASGDRQHLATWLLCMRAFSGPKPATAEIIPALDQLVDALAPVLLPDALRRVIDGKARLILSPHRTLHLFPFHAARWDLAGGATAASAAGDDRPWLIQRFAVRYAPNLTSLLHDWSGRREGPVLAVGIGNFGDSGLPAIKNAPLEAAEVAAVHGAAGSAAIDCSRAAFLALPLPGVRCLHLATHGSSVLTGEALDDPLDCGIALADGVLDGWQLGTLDLPAELVVLAACYSGQRAISGRGLSRLPGDDLFGLQAVLFEAGVGTLLGALWPVDDRSARAILVDFHRAYAAGAAPDLALQSALVAHLADPLRRQTRYDWAPFFLTSLRNPRYGRTPGQVAVSQSSSRSPVGG
ncbi:CHAT domain-containing protein [Candidatus Thiodictyon syntrophicum]|uniref:CHAT domain-containing protein n=1 Tax=Candidatus Thiodictyon syntrophicum TaxID=1166950 RepID=UPI000C2CEE7F|nr:CHAT domain-containing protein [Candidatus Thiodictyon syntrophicum]